MDHRIEILVEKIEVIKVAHVLGAWEQGFLSMTSLRLDFQRRARGKTIDTLTSSWYESPRRIGPINCCMVSGASDCGRNDAENGQIYGFGEQSDIQTDRQCFFHSVPRRWKSGNRIGMVPNEKRTSIFLVLSVRESPRGVGRRWLEGLK